MAKIGIFYGSSTEKTAKAAKQIHAVLGGDNIADLFDIGDYEVTELLEYDYLILGCPTWNIGDIQEDWKKVFGALDQLDFSGKTVAYFGTGDQINYAENFQDAMGLLEEKIAGCGGKTVGLWSALGYNHTASKALRGDQFCGLALDEDNEFFRTSERIQEWCAQLKQEFELN